MPVDELAFEAVEIFGGSRVDVEPRLDDAIDAAVTAAEDDTRLGGSGVIIHRIARDGRRGPAAARRATRPKSVI